ncbi:MAG: Jag N-terminal domain-containing protein [Anaerolineales bacterium]|nr:Jag N-terminal domain-containing protein [Anaerolineales bacterium]
MTLQKQEIDAKGRTVDDAIESGLARLGVERDAVEIEILDEGSRGILGLGSRDAAVRLTLKKAPVPEIVPEPEPAPVSVEPAQIEENEVFVEEEVVEATAVVSTPPSKPAEKAPVAAPSVGAKGLPLNAEAEIALEVISTIVNSMHVDAATSLRLSEEDNLTGERINIVDVTGDDLGVLIGPRGETLDALQYLSRLIVGQRMHGRANFVVDVEGYRERRKTALARMAERMAAKAVKQERPITLEPMAAYERRIIHMTLRDSTEVRTESTGEGNRRRVRIFPK